MDVDFRDLKFEKYLCVLKKNCGFRHIFICLEFRSIFVFRYIFVCFEIYLRINSEIYLCCCSCGRGIIIKLDT